MKNAEGHKTLLYTSILYICGFLLFMEWIYPVNEITATNSISVFIIYAIFCFIISAFQLKWWVSFLLKGFALVFIINGLFFEARVLSQLWLEQGFLEISYNLEALLAQNWHNLTPMFRSTLFLILIWLMSYLLHYWFVVMKRIFLFVMLTFIYIAVLDTFTVYDAGMPMVRTFVIAFIALGIANFMRELNKEGIQFKWVKKTPIWLIPLLVTVFFASVIGYAAPKSPPQWPDPVPFLQSAAENAGSRNGGGAVQKVGYGEDDSQLGGSFVQDYTPVFQAAVNEAHYWRIETKDMYTGKGWEASGEPEYQRMTGGIALNTFNPGSDGVDTESLESIVEFEDNVSIEKLVYPYGLRHAYAAQATFHIDRITEAVQTQINHEVIQLEQYTLSYDKPSFSVDKLREIEQEENPVDERFTQLPESLPERVVDLAVEITEQYDTQYDKVKAVEQYFSSNDFQYETTGVPVPEEDEDYVDQFLFESQIGYCDNFSTSMVVMLRSLDIPARWAKGFTGGEIIQENDSNTGDSFDVYEITNSNAHSWVEVYFDGVGWVPFEPTQGFDNMTDFHTEIEDGEAEVEEESDPMEVPEMDTPDPPEEAEEEESETAMAGNNTSYYDFAWWHAGLIIALIFLIGFLIYKTRFRWQTYLMNQKLTRNQDAAVYQDAYAHLLKILAHAGLKREPDQTLREYAKRIDARFSTNEMGQLTAHLEKIIYKNEQNEEKTNELAEVWKNLINRIMT